MTKLRSLVSELGAVDSTRRVFGAGSHGYSLKPASPEALLAFESRWRVRLPEVFRSFVCEVTDGGAGPGYGLFALARVKGDDVDENLELLAQPFDEAFLTALAPDLDPEDDEEAHDAAMDVYWRPIPGTMTLCHYGCAIRAQLIATGRLAGQVLLDRRCDAEGIGVALFNRAAHGAWNGYGRPRERDATSLDFAAWYEDWLQTSLALVQGRAKTPAR
jgi:hypothetical protein